MASVSGQSTAGLTGVRDTSFSLQRELEKLKKNYPFIEPVHLVPGPQVNVVKDIAYCTVGSRKLLLDAFFPSEKINRPRPAVMIIHGGGWRSGERSQHHPLAQRLAELGYVCFTPEYRLSTEALYPAAVHDLQSALRWIHANAKLYQVDTSRIVVAGFSAGGQMAALLGTTSQKNLFDKNPCHPKVSVSIKAVINMDGILAFIHPESGEGDDSKKLSAATQWFGFSKAEKPEIWHQASALTHVGMFTPPTLFINSSVDRMHAGREDFIKTLDHYGIYHEVKTFKGAPHSFPLFQPWFDSTVLLMDGFMKKVFETVDQVQPGEKTFPANGVSKVWVADRGDGTYQNPVLHADYSDPDAIRVGDDYYMVASSFEDVPGLPVLHSKDLVNWRLVGHALNNLVPVEHFSRPRHGEGVWAPSIRYHKGEFYIYYPDPDFGIYLTRAKHPAGPWTEPVLVAAGRGLIDPCPLWDDDGQNYLVHAFAGSRAGIKSVLVVRKLNSEGTKTLDQGVLVYDGHVLDPTVEGPKFYKHHGYYYIFAPAGGVATGWQLVLRSRNVYGPYERKIVLHQGSTKINGPHQGAWVRTQSGEDWFLHFQDKEAYGRIVHLQPMKWVEGWPVIGMDADGDGIGEPVSRYKKPNGGKTYPVQTPAESDEFNHHQLGLQWQWMANPRSTWAFLNATRGVLMLFSDKLPDSAKNLWMAPNVLQQKFPAENFTVTTKLWFRPNQKLEQEKAGLAVMGTDYAYLAIQSAKAGNRLILVQCRNADKGNAENETVIANAPSGPLYFRVRVTSGAVCQFSYSFDGIHFTNAGEPFQAVPGRWKGAKLGLFCTRETVTNDSGYAEVDWFRITAAD